MRLTELLFFLPAVVSMLWVIMFMLSVKTHRQKVALVCLVISTVYFIGYGMWTLPGTDYSQYVRIEPVGLPLAMFLATMMGIYMNLHATGGKVHFSHMLLLAPALMYGTSLCTLYYIIGFDGAERFYLARDSGNPLPAEFTTRLYDTFNLVAHYSMMYLGFVLILFVYVECVYVLYRKGYHFGDFCRFMLMRHRANPSSVVAISAMALITLLLPVTLLPTWVSYHPRLGMMLAMGIAIMLHLLCFTEFHSNKVSLDAVHLVDAINAAGLFENGKEPLAEEEEDEEDDAVAEEEGESPSTIHTKRVASMFIRFKALMTEEQLYLNADITINDVAERLLVGRATLSNMINHEFGKNFRGVINDYRIDYAKQYMLENPGMTQEMIAMSCGFKDAPAFSHKFKDVVGMSPLAWLTSQTKREV